VSPNNLEIRCDVGIVPLEVPPDREQVRRFAQSLNHCQVDISTFGRHFRQKCVIGLQDRVLAGERNGFVDLVVIHCSYELCSVGF